MRKQLVLVLVVVMMGILMLSPNTTNATPFTFSGSDSGGEVSGAMDVTFGTKTIVAVMDNTSPTILMLGYTNDDGTNWNAPGITEFGFNINPDILSNTYTWELLANDNTDNINLDWNVTIDELGGGVKFEFLADADGVHGALYNPLANPAYFGNNPAITQATLTVTFAEDLVEPSTASDPYMKFQNVGVDGDGSEKTSVPDASIMWLLGPSFICLGLLGRRKSKKS